MINESKVINNTMIKFKDTKNVEHQLYQKVMSNRGILICRLLTNLKLHYAVDVYSPHTTNEYLRMLYVQHNIIVYLTPQNSDKKTVVINAHHDVANLNSDNCNDNTASVVNLLILMKYIVQNDIKFDKNIIISFTDCEEYGGVGAKQLMKFFDEKGMDIEYILNLELSGIGSSLWKENVENSKLSDKLSTYVDVTNPCPFSDSTIFRNKFDSITIGTLPTKTDGGYDYSVWSKCHSMLDTEYDPEDMNSFVNVLFNFLKDDK